MVQVLQSIEMVHTHTHRHARLFCPEETSMLSKRSENGSGSLGSARSGRRAQFTKQDRQWVSRSNDMLCVAVDPG